MRNNRPSTASFFGCLLGLTSTFFLASAPAHGQVNQPTERAFIVIGQDTLRGYASFTSAKRLSRYVEFGKTIDGPKKAYYPYDIKSYYLFESDQLFVTGTILANRAYDSTFLRVLATGAVDVLYLDSRGNKPDFWIRKGDEVHVLDKGITNVKMINGREFKVGSKPYLRTLEKIFTDCFQDTLTIPYSTPHILEVTARYNNCHHVKMVRHRESPKTYWRMGLLLSVMNSALTFEDRKTVTRPYQYPSIAPDGTYDFSEITATTLQSNSVGAGLATVLYPGGLKRLSFAADIILISRHWKAPIVSLDLNYIQVPLSMRYHINPSRKLQFVAGAGLDLALCYASKYNKTSHPWTFTRARPRVSGSGDTYPDQFEVSMPLFFEKEFKPSAIFPFISAGADFHLDNGFVIGFSYRFESFGSITKSPLYDTSVTNHLFALTTTFAGKKK